MLRNKYMSSIMTLSEKYHDAFGRVWWYSLLHEKNTSKSFAYHRLAKGLHPEKISFIKSIYLLFRKFFSLLYRHFYFGRKSLSNQGKVLIISYDIDFMYPFGFVDGEWIFFPQKRNLRDYKDKIVVDHYVGLMDIVSCLLKCFMLMPKHIYFVTKLKDDFNTVFEYRYFRKEIYRSFFGDILLEGLFFDAVFRNIDKRLVPIKVIYPYEGQAWEKALCLNMSCEKIALLCSCPSYNDLQFWYDSREIWMMPVPDRFGVLGKVTHQAFLPIYGEGRVFINGPMRFRKIIVELEKNKRKGNDTDKRPNAVICPSNNEQAKDLIISCLANKNNRDLVFKLHPDNDIDVEILCNRKIILTDMSIIELLCYVDKIFSYGTSVAVLAAIAGVENIVPDLPFFIKMTPLDLYNEAKTMEDYFDMSKDERRLLL